MRILAIYRHYHPDVAPYAPILKTLLESWAAAGHQVTVLAGQPAYGRNIPPQPREELLGGVRVIRFDLPSDASRKNWRRFAAYSAFLAKATWFAAHDSDYDVVLGNSHPPVMMGATLRLIHRLTGMPYIYHCQDLHPESAALAGKLKSPTLVKALLGIERKTCDSASAVVTLSDDMAETLAERGVSADRIQIIPNPTPALNATNADLPEVFLRPNEFRVLYAGNLGDFQGLDVVLDAAERTRERSDLRWIFMGEGSARERLSARANERALANVTFLPRQSAETAFAAAGASHLGVVSLLPGVYQVAWPSKSLTYWAAGCPVLGVVEPQSRLATTIAEHSLGVVSQARTGAAVAEAVLEAQAATGLSPGRAAIRRFAEHRFGRRRILEAWDRLALRPLFPSESDRDTLDDTFVEELERKCA
ncbi:MAG TPA: glycosyltransferase family 4 protein [Pirellulaceae bacterium]|jgi:glycosyltransferase involved in cell wall biosynthesis|nr:glycosyltransferase family 4 protein [Pirellulaceae bacterium]